MITCKFIIFHIWLYEKKIDERFYEMEKGKKKKKKWWWKVKARKRQIKKEMRFLVWKVQKFISWKL